MVNNQEPLACWSCYLLESGQDGSFYAGVAKDVLARLASHNRGSGAKRTRSRGPWQVVWQIAGLTHSEALKMEAQVKKLPRHEKPYWCVVKFQTQDS
jgi:putative endonuclease